MHNNNNGIKHLPRKKAYPCCIRCKLYPLTVNYCCQCSQSEYGSSYCNDSSNSSADLSFWSAEAGSHPDPNKTARLIYQPDVSTVCSFLAVETCDQTQRVISHDSPVSSDKQKLCERALDDREMRETVFLLLPSVGVPASFNLLAELIPACPQLSYFFVTLFPNFTCNLTHPFTLPLLVFLFFSYLLLPSSG